MKRTILFAFLFCISAIQVFSQTNMKVRFDGLYQTELNIKSDSRRFLRFYSDNTVLSVSSTGEATDVIQWLEKPYHDHGKYEIKENKIYFSTTSSYGTVLYEGLIESKNVLKLKLKSLINGHESEQIFQFIKVRSKAKEKH